jgi:hypothetical protein
VSLLFVETLGGEKQSSPLIIGDRMSRNAFTRKSVIVKLNGLTKRGTPQRCDSCVTGSELHCIKTSQNSLFVFDTVGPEFTQLAKRFGQNLVSKLFQHS